MNQKGVTLIALVITIVIMLILAGITLNMVLRDDGIITQAQNTNDMHKKAEEEQKLVIAAKEAALSEKIDESLAAEDVEEKLGDIFENNASYNNSLREIKEFKVDDEIEYLPIPKGMSYAYGTINEGAIVVDGYGNEYVWVPIDEILESWPEERGKESDVRYADDKISLIHKNSDQSIEPSDGKNLTNNMPQEYEAMKTSVATYGGFYIGRYETGGFNTTRVVSKPGQDKESCVKSDKLTWYDAYSMQKELHANSSSIVSGMIYNSQWDAIMDWLSDVVNPNVTDESNNLYINNSTGMGNLNDVSNNKPIITGLNPAYEVKHIYDLAGNYWEWTQSASGSKYRIPRGSSYVLYKAASRSYTYNPLSPNGYSSRIQIYIK